MTTISRNLPLPVPVSPHGLPAPRANGGAPRPEAVRPVPAIEAQPKQSDSFRKEPRQVRAPLEQEVRREEGRIKQPQIHSYERAQGATGPAAATTNPETAFSLHQLSESGSEPVFGKARSGFAQISAVLAKHRDGPALGSDFYRRAGGEPGIYSESATLLRLAI